MNFSLEGDGQSSLQKHSGTPVETAGVWSVWSVPWGPMLSTGEMKTGQKQVFVPNAMLCDSGSPQRVVDPLCVLVIFPTVVTK